MKSDAELLRLYLEDNSEEAFTELVHRYIGLVYSTAVRRLGGDTHLAEDVTQRIFTDLAKKARSLRQHRTLGGWLFVSTQMATASVVRGERRRKTRELEAEFMRTTSTSSDTEPDLSRLRPVLDEIITELRSEEREAIVLRFFEKRTFAEIGAALRVSEEAARKRVDRTLEKLQAVLARKGIVSTATALGISLAATGVISVPAGLAAKITGTAIAQASVAGGASALGSVIAATVPTGMALLLVGLPIARQHGTNQILRAEILRQSTSLQAALDRSENARKASVFADSEERQSLRKELAALRVSLTAPAPAPARSAPLAVTVTPRGQLRWGGQPVTLDEYLARTRSLREASPTGESRVEINAMGAKLSQLAWTLDEARKADIQHIVVESDAVADPTLSQSWF